VKGLHRQMQLSLADRNTHDFSAHKHLWNPQTDFTSFIYIIFYDVRTSPEISIWPWRPEDGLRSCGSPVIDG